MMEQAIEGPGVVVVGVGGASMLGPDVLEDTVVGAWVVG